MVKNSRIVEISDDQALGLLHPNVFERLGDRELKRTIRFDIDNQVSKTLIDYDFGVLEIKRDYNVIYLQAKTKEDEQIVLFGLRDRRFDGTKDYKTPLTGWQYGFPADKVSVPTLELSRYSRDPDRYWQESDLVKFLKEPFDFMFGDSDIFIELWKRAFQTGHFPGQSALPLRGAAKFFKNKAVDLASDLGFVITASPSHLYVAQSDIKNNFYFQSSHQKREIELIEEQLYNFDLNPLIRRQQESWIVLLQKFPDLKNSELFDFYLDGLEFPLFYDGKSTENIWLVHGKENTDKFIDFRPIECIKRLARYGF